MSPASSILKGCIISERIVNAVSLMRSGQIMPVLSQFWSNAGSICKQRAWWAKGGNEGRDVIVA